MTTKEQSRMDTLVTTDWLNHHLDDPDLVVLDCTVSVKPGGDDGFQIVSGRADYETGHIPGAGFLDLTAELSDPSSPFAFTLPAPVTLAEYSLPTGEPLEGTFWIRGVLLVPERAAPGPRRIPLILTLQACGASSCQAPRDLALDLPLRFDSEADGERRHPGVFGD